MIELPLKIENAIAEILSRVDMRSWTKSAIALSAKYRQSRDNQDAADNIFVNNAEDVRGYLALRTTATYAQLYGAMRQIAELMPGWEPLSILDIGSGPGTAVWAASEMWPGLNRVTCLERDGNFSKTGKEILGSIVPKSFAIDWKTVDLSLAKPEIDDKYDLVSIGSVLNEMSPEQQKSLLEFAHEHCRGVLLVVEPATPTGFGVIKQATTYLCSLTGFLLAPYINDALVTSTADQIGFGQSIIRPEFLKRIRQMQRKLSSTDNKPLLPASDWEETKYAYIAISMQPAEIRPWARLIAKPVIVKGYIELKILTETKIETIKVMKSDKAQYKLAKKLKWGDLIESSVELLRYM